MLTTTGTTDAPVEGAQLAEPLRFQIKRSPALPSSIPAHLRDAYAQWYVFGTRPDDGGDPCWGHFTTWAAAIDFAERNLIRAEADRLDQQLDTAIAAEPA